MDHHTIYEELISTKQSTIIDMENRLRSLEQEMKTTTGVCSGQPDEYLHKTESPV